MPRSHRADDILRDYVAVQAAHLGVPSVDFIATRGTCCAYCGDGRLSFVIRSKFVGKVWHDDRPITPEQNPSCFRRVCSSCGREWSARHVLQGKISGAAGTVRGPTTGRAIVAGARTSAPEMQTMASRPTRPASGAPVIERLADRMIGLEQIIEPTPQGLTAYDWSFCLTALFARAHLDALRCRMGISWPREEGAAQPPWQPIVVAWGDQHRPEFVWTEHRVRWAVREARKVIEARAGGVRERRAS